MARKRKDDNAPVAAVPVEEQAAAVEAVPAPAIEAPVVSAPSASQWRVGETKRVALFGHMTTITKGDVVSVNEYGPEGIERLREQGVALEPV